MGALQEDGKPLRDHLNNLWRQTGIKPRQLQDAPELPSLGAYLWLWFVEMHAERESNGMSAGRISARAMQGWCWATGNVLNLWERKTLRMIDRTWMEQSGKNER